MKVIGIQMDIAWENKPANFATVRAMLAQAKPPPGSLVALPEMFTTGFSMNAEATAEPYGSETEQFLTKTAKELRICLVAGAAVRSQDGHARNKALVFGPNGNLLDFYAKMRLFTPGGEPDHYTPGERTTAFEFEGCVVSPFICYDLRFPELFREAVADRQPEIFVVIASWPAKRVTHWMRLLQARAIENQAYVLGVNRVGTDPFYSYSGRSLIIDPQGEILADAGEQPCTISADLDLAGLKQYRKGLPFLRDFMRSLEH